MKKFPQLSLFFLLLIILLASFVRFYKLELKMRFIWDEGRDMMAIHRLVVAKNLTLFGPFNEIDGKKDFFGVFHYYLMAPALLLADFDPIGPAVLTVFLGVLSVGLVYLLVRQWSSEKTALLTSFFYAVSPLVIKYVQWPWNPNTLPFFALLYFLCLTNLLKKDKIKLIWVGLAGLMLGLLFQLHYFSLPLVIAYLLIFFHDRKKHWSELILFSLLFILPNLSFLIFDLTHDFFYFKILKESFFGGSDQQYFSFNLINFLIIPIKFIFNLLIGLFFTSKLLIIFLELIFFWLVFKNIKHYFITKEINLKILLSFVWFCFFLMIGFFPTVFDEYHSSYLWFGFFYLFIEFFGQKKLMLIFYFLLALLMYKNINLNRQPNWSENLPLLRSLSEIIVNDYKDNYSGKKVNLASLTDVDTRATRYRYFLQKEKILVDGVDQYPQATVLYVISPHDLAKTKSNQAWEIASFLDQVWVEVGVVDQIFIYRVTKD
ncbi:MAG: glycosyltransferase family 39 protein [Patescibacteria group bacterium]